MTSAGVMMANVSLEHDEHRLGNCAVDRVAIDPEQEQLAEAADPRVGDAAVAERQSVAADQPENRHDASDGHALHQDRQRVLGAHEARIEGGEPRQRHEQHQRSRRQHPCGVAGIERGRGVRGHRGARHEQRCATPSQCVSRPHDRIPLKRSLIARRNAHREVHATGALDYRIRCALKCDGQRALERLWTDVTASPPPT
jgi:hypothetical protein